jgi:hypothetical protein
MGNEIQMGKPNPQGIEGEDVIHSVSMTTKAAKLLHSSRRNSLAFIIESVHSVHLTTMADIQRRGSILAWIIILSVYGADTIAETKSLISPFLI